MGIESTGLRIAEFAGLRGMAATRDLDSGAALVSLPVSAALVVTPKARSALPSSFCSGEFFSKKPWFVQMALKLLYERQLGKESRLAHYVENLPRNFSSPLTWTNVELAALQYPFLQQEVTKMKAGLKQVHADLAASTPGTPVTEADLTWAIQAVRSRAFSGPYAGPPLKSRVKIAGALALLAGVFVTAAHVPLEQVLNGAIAAALFNLLYDLVLSQKVKWYAMCPVVDFMNHNSSIQSSVEYEYFKDCFTISCAASFKKGEQVFISYGPQSNDSLLQYYGFVEPDIPHDTYIVPDLAAAVPDAVSSSSPPSIKAVLTKKGLDEQTLQALRAANLNDQQIKEVLRSTCNAELRRIEEAPARDTPLAQAFRREKASVLRACLKIV
ncbi:g7084 [Coccomyxa viridis]|uniref:G7084 protein n=1 Tax=Coccomyxa viridis TaxID=1274662 RepID=A0ABP1G3L9_9CHLO